MKKKIKDKKVKMVDVPLRVWSSGKLINDTKIKTLKGSTLDKAAKILSNVK